VKAIIEVSRCNPRYRAQVKAPSGVFAGHGFGGSIIKAIDDAVNIARGQGYDQPVTVFTEGTRDEYIAECNAEKCHKIAIDITECERMLLDLYQNAWQQLPPRPRAIIYDACGQMQKFIKELHEEMKAMGYLYDDETESAIKIEEENV